MNSERLLTVAQLAEIVADPVLGDDQQLVLRQLRYWSTIGLIKPVGGSFTGRGRHRRYQLQEVYRAGLLVRFGALGLPVAALTELNNKLDQEIRHRAAFDSATAASMAPVEREEYEKRLWDSWRWKTEHALDQVLAFRFIPGARTGAIDRSFFALATSNFSDADSVVRDNPDLFGGGGVNLSFLGFGATIIINLTQLFRRLTVRLPS
jgi:DNA-binding transcriptional MerR regulator